MKVATFENSVWLWKATNTTVVCLGDFVDFYRVANGLEVSTRAAIDQEIKIITCFRSLQAQASEAANNSAFIVLLGNHELANILLLPDFWPFSIQNPDSEVERRMRINFIREHLLDFADSCGLIVRWGDVFMCHGGLEAGWLHRHKFQSVEHINKRFRSMLRDKREDRLKIFMEHDSLLVSRKIAFRTDEWRQTDKPEIGLILGPVVNPKFVVGHTAVSQILETQSFSAPQCSSDKDNTSILASKDYFGNDDVFFIDVSMSRGFLPRNASEWDKHAQRPQALRFELTTDEEMNELFMECNTV
jgi:hypothetical protein